MSDDIHALIGAYALDAVSAQERADFEEHLTVCADCRGELAGLRQTLAEIAGSVPATPPASLRGDVLSAITNVRQLPPVVPTETARKPKRQRRQWNQRWLVAAAAAAAVIIGGLTWHPWTGSEPTPVSAVQQVEQAPDAHRYVTQLKGAKATVTFSPELGKSVLETHHMPPAPAGHTYQLWYMTAAGKATPAGFVTPSAAGHSTVLLTGHAGGAALIGMTVEPAGGSAQPTTKPIMTVKLT
jgi:anti-sigma-K factor RskA